MLLYNILFDCNILFVMTWLSRDTKVSMTYVMSTWMKWSEWQGIATNNNISRSNREVSCGVLSVCLFILLCMHLVYLSISQPSGLLLGFVWKVLKN